MIGALVYASGGAVTLSYALGESRGGKLNFVNNRKDCDYEKRKTIVKTDRAIYSVPYTKNKLHGADMPKLG